LTGLIFTSCKQSDKRSIAKEKAESKQTENTAAQIYAKPEIPVLCYHQIAEGKKSDYAVSPATFSVAIIPSHRQNCTIIWFTTKLCPKNRF